MTDLRTIEKESIRAFVQSAADEGYLSGRVLDYGCGKQPYRDIVEAAGGEYEGYDRIDFGGNVSGTDIGESPFHNFQIRWNEVYSSRDAILCTQVVQYVRRVDMLVSDFDVLLANRGHLVLTYPTNWPEVEPEDLHRFTKAGMERLLVEAGFEIVRHDLRAAVYANIADTPHRNVRFALGYGVIARA